MIIRGDGLNNPDCIRYPTEYHKAYVEKLYAYCLRNKLSLILKGSLAKGTAKQFSDIDVIVLGKLTDTEINDLILLHGQPVMSNLTEQPRGILILNYRDISVDLDLRQTVAQEDLQNAKILLQWETDFCVSTEVIRYESHSFPDRPDWYKTLRLIHRALIKYLVGNTESAGALLSELKEKLRKLGVNHVNLTGNFITDVSRILDSLWIKYRYSAEIKELFDSMLCNLQQ